MADLMSKKSFAESNISISMQPSPELTEGQKACLRLVVQHHTSKEIARKLGISPFTVDQRLDAARRKLNAASRKDAAKMFAELEKRAISQPLVYETVPIELASFTASQRATPGRVRHGFTKVFSFVSVPPTGGERHELSGKQILVHALNIAFFSSLVLAFVVVVLTGTFRLFQ
ncbi:MAG: helix-turn-helix transcriptional regulator [Pseudomonadota bacterium]